MYPREILIGTRGSKLALIQTQEVINLLKRKFPELRFIPRIIVTRGDREEDSDSMERGRFVREIEQALLKGEIDLAVHSLKDLPTELPSGLIISAVPPRRTSHDAFISVEGKNLDEIAPGSRIGTSSLRRKAQILSFRRDLEVVPLRGNVDTRIRKLRRGEIDGIVCALCALERLGLPESGFQKLPHSHFLPSPAQGALGIEIREDDDSLREITAEINHPPSFLATRLEREFLKTLKAGCRLPVGVFAQIEKNMVKMVGAVYLPDGSRWIRVEETVPEREAMGLGKKLADKLLRKGAEEILESSKLLSG